MIVVYTYLRANMFPKCNSWFLFKDGKIVVIPMEACEVFKRLPPACNDETFIR